MSVETEGVPAPEVLSLPEGVLHSTGVGRPSPLLFSSYGKYSLTVIFLSLLQDALVKEIR